MKITSNFILSLFFVAGLSACGGDSNNGSNPEASLTPTPTPEPETIVDVAVANGNFTTLVAALQATGLDDVLDDENATFTVFAPTDAAFAKLGDDVITALLADTDTLSDILLYHVVSGSAIDASTAVAAAGTEISMANGSATGLSLSGDNLLINLSMVTMTDITTDNGVIHVIDTVLSPPAERGEPSANIVDTAIGAGSFTTLVAALQAADLVTTLADPDATFTVFAPTDAAFERLGAANVAALLEDTALLAEILTQHVIVGEVNSVSAYTLNGTSASTVAEADIAISINDGKLRFGGAEVEVVDIYTTNGVIHVIDTVVVGSAGLPAPAENIAQVASAAGSFSTLIAALQATGLDSVIADNESTFTVFAPTDDAFDKLGQDTIDALLADTDTLRDILLYHVISDAAVLADTAASVAASSSPFVTMTNSDKAALSLDGDNLVLNLSAVTAANVMASNGVIHVLDTVMLPPSDPEAASATIAEIATMTESLSTLTSALQAAGLVAALDDASSTFTVFAPTNAAFDLVGEEALNALLADVDALTQVLGLHVIPGAAVDSVSAFSLNGKSAVTLSGEAVSVNVIDGALQVGGATVTTFDIQATNGVVHVIDAVITEAQ